MLARILTLIVVPLALLVTPASASSRVALVIGNNNYGSLTKLHNPKLDAERLASILVQHGFDVIKCDGKNPGCFDVTRDGLEDALAELGRKADGAELALVFYAGHGMEGADGNVLAPIDMTLDCASKSTRRAVLLHDVFKKLEGARQRIVIIDACRDNPLAQCPTRGSVPMSFRALTAPDAHSFLLVSSTKPGQVALDGIEGQHSPFARALFQWLEKSPRLYFHQLLQLHVAKTVIESTSRSGFTQVPETLTRGVAPDACLIGSGCAADERENAVKEELERLRTERARDQIAESYLALKEKGLGRALSAEERRRELEELHRVVRGLAAQNDTRSEEALSRMQAGDAEAAKKLYAEVLAAREQEAADLLARAHAMAAEKKREAARAARSLAALERLTNVAKSAEHYKKATDLDPADAETWLKYAYAAKDAGNAPDAKMALEQAALKARDGNDALTSYWAMVGLGDIAKDQGSLPTAERHYRAALAMVEEAAKSNPASRRILSALHTRIGVLLKEQGNLPAALASLKLAMAIDEELSNSDPGNTLWQRYLSVSHQAIAVVQLMQGELANALRSYRAALAIGERLAKADPTNAQLLQLLSSLHTQIGLAENLHGNITGALKSYQEALAIGERLAKSDPTNAEWSLLLSMSHTVIGGAQRIRGDLTAALKSYQAALAIGERLAKSDPTNTRWQRLLSTSHALFGSAQRAQGDLTGALKSHQAVLTIGERLAMADPTNSEWSLLLLLAHLQIGTVQRAQGNLADALKSYQAALAIGERLAQADQTATALIHQQISVSHIGASVVQQEQGDLTGALASAKAALSIVERLVKADPTNSLWQGLLAESHKQMGTVQQAQGSLDDALESANAALGIAERLAKTNPTNSEYSRLLSQSHAVMGSVLQSQRNPSGALESFEAARAITEQLVKIDPTNAEWQQDLSGTRSKVAGALLARGEREGALAEWRKALAVSEVLAGTIERLEAERLGRPGTSTARALVAVARYALFSREFKKALAASDRARTLAPELVLIDANRAHALLFLKRVDEARRLYMAHMGKDVGGRTWKKVIADDFTELEKAGLIVRGKTALGLAGPEPKTVRRRAERGAQASK